MKDTSIRFRIASDEKRLVEEDAVLAGFDDVSPYLMQLIRQNRKKLRKA